MKTCALLVGLLLAVTATADTSYRVSNWSGQTIYFRLDLGDELNPDNAVAAIGQGETYETDGGDVTTFLVRPYFSTNWTEYTFTAKYAWANQIEIQVLQDYSVRYGQSRTNVGYFWYGFTVACGFGLSAIMLRLLKTIGHPSPEL